MVLSIFVAAIALLLPALQSSRFRARLALCQDNLRELGLAAIRYSNTHHGYFPAVPREGKLAFAGVYAPTLLQSRLLDDARRIVCPDSPLASVSGFRLPSLKELEALPTEELTPMLPQIGGSYGYTLGHLHEGAYRDTRNLGRQWFALLADAPSGDRRQSVNHDGRGTNVLFEDGHVRFLQCPRLTSVADDFFANDEGQVAAGLHPNDSVIAPSATSPKTALPALPSPTP
jgi:prepilin-type processing-associated H-X9-DG protein